MSREQVSVTKVLVQCLCMTPVMRTKRWTHCFSKMTSSDSARVNSLSSPEWQLFTWYGNKPAYKFRKRVSCAGCIDLLYVPEAFYLVEKEKKSVSIYFLTWTEPLGEVFSGGILGLPKPVEHCSGDVKSRCPSPAYLAELFRTLLQGFSETSAW